MESIEEYIERLQAHDWYYTYSDDGRTFRRGDAERDRLNHLQKKFDPDFKIWNEHAPKDFKKEPK